MEEAAVLSRKYQQKKEVIENILNDLDKEANVSSTHIGGISAVNELLKELDEIEEKHAQVLENIKAN